MTKRALFVISLPRIFQHTYSITCLLINTKEIFFIPLYLILATSPSFWDHQCCPIFDFFKPFPYDKSSFVKLKLRLWQRTSERPWLVQKHYYGMINRHFGKLFNNRSYYNFTKLVVEKKIRI